MCEFLGIGARCIRQRGMCMEWIGRVRRGERLCDMGWKIVLLVVSAEHDFCE